MNPRILHILAFILLASPIAHAQFVPNAGQVIDDRGALRPDIAFTAAQRNLLLYFQSDRISYVMRDVRRTSRNDEQLLPTPQLAASDTVATYRVDLELVGARADVHPTGIGPINERLNFYYSHTGDGIRNVQPFAEVMYRDIYPAVDLRYALTPSGYKYEFIVRPGGRVGDIRMRYHGATSIAIDASGQVRVATPLGELVDGVPVSFTMVNGNDTAKVASRFIVEADVVRFDVDAYDRARTLVVDPTIMWATYYGGPDYESSSYVGVAPSLAVDAEGGITQCATAASPSFPTTTGALQTSLAGAADALLMRFRRNGTRDWATYLGGSASEMAGGVAIDRAGNIYHSGTTASLDFPVTAGAHQTSYAGGTDAYIIKLDSNGARIWSTYFGGTSADYNGGVGVDTIGRFYFVMPTFSADITTTGAFQTTMIGTTYNTAVARFDTAGSLFWCTLAGQGITLGMAVEGNSDVYFSGYCSNTTTFPITAGAYQSVIAGQSDAFIGSFDSTGAQRWATFIGGTSWDVGFGITTDSNRNVFMVGYTQSTNYPTSTNAFQRTNAGGFDGFVSSFTGNGAPRWSTMYGASGNETFNCVDVDIDGNVAVTGWTQSTGFPVTTPELPGPRGSQEGTIIVLDNDGSRQWASRLGGSGYEYPYAQVVADQDAIVVSMTTASTDAPSTTGAQQTSNGGDADLFFVRICPLVSRIQTTGSRSLCDGDSIVLSAPAGVSVRWSNGATTPSITVRDPGTYWHDATGRSCTVRSDTIVVTRLSATVAITESGPLSFCNGDSVRLDAGAGPLSYEWSTGETSRAIVARSTGRYRVAIIAPNGCRAYDTVDVVARALPRPIATASARTFCPGDSVTLELPAGYLRYSWSTGDTLRRINVRNGGRYTFTVVDSSGCRSLPDTISVTRFAKPVVDVTPRSLALCNGDTLTLAATPGFVRYQWSTGETGDRIRITSAGAYRVVAIDANGCRSDTITANITTFARPTVDIATGGSTTICDGDSVLLYTARRFNSYRWSNGDTTAYTHVKRDGNYTLTIVDSNGCRDSATVTVVVRAQPVAKITASGPLQFCSGGEVELRLAGAANAQWSNGAFGPVIRVTGSGTYYADIIDEAGCRGRSDTVVVVVSPSPNATLTGQLILCRNNEATYAVAPDARYRYQWELRGGDGAVTSRTDSNAVHVRWGSIGGTVRVVVEDMATGCRDTVEAVVTIGTSVRPAIAASGTQLCPGDSVVLDAGTGYRQYRWSNSATSSQIVVRAPGRYAVWVENADGCSGTSDTIEVRAGIAPTPIVVANGPLSLCRGSSITLSTSDYATYEWSNGATSRDITVTSGGIYTVTVRDTSGCIGTSAPVVVTVVDPPRVTITGPTGACPNSEVMYCVDDNTLVDLVWTVTGGTIVGNDRGTCITVRWGSGSAGSVQLRASEPIARCGATSDPLLVDLSIGLRPTITVVGAAQCEGDTVTLDAGSGYASYRWNTGATSRTISAVSTGTYTVDVSDPTGCAGSASIDLRFSPKPVPVLDPTGVVELCRGDSIVINAPVGYPAYKWSNGATTPSITVRDGGSYYVTVSDSNGCSGASSPTTVSIIERPSVRILRRGDTLIAQTDAGTWTYQWLLDGNAIAGEVTDRTIARTPGSYRVIVDNTRRCGGESGDVIVHASTGQLHFTLDTVTARVGDRLLLTLSAVMDQPLIDISSASIEIRYEPRSLFLHRVIDDGIFTVSHPTAGTLVLEHGAGVLRRGTLARLELEGLATAVPVNPVTFIRALVDAVDSVSTSDGLVLLTGCIVTHSAAFGRAVTIESVTPNPASRALYVQFNAPAGADVRLSLRDITGREVYLSHVTATGNTEVARVDLAQVASGYYVVELRDRGERAVVPVVVVE